MTILHQYSYSSVNWSKLHLTLDLMVFHKATRKLAPSGGDPANFSLCRGSGGARLSPAGPYYAVLAAMARKNWITIGI